MAVVRRPQRQPTYGDRIVVMIAAWTVRATVGRGSYLHKYFVDGVDFRLPQVSGTGNVEVHPSRVPPPAYPRPALVAN
jgi:hypothetical protein